MNIPAEIKPGMPVTPEFIERAEAKMLGMEQASCEVIHRFGPGLYIRELRMKAGTFAIGHRQTTKHMNVMLCGRAIMLNPDGSTTELIAPQTFVSEPGRKIGYIVEDIVWQNIYATDKTDIDELESIYLEKSPVFMDDFENKRAISVLEHHASRSDYERMLVELGVTEEIVRAQSECTDDFIEMPEPVHPYRIVNSPIEGKGYFLTADAGSGDILAPAKIEEKRTPAGRYVNHSNTPNARMFPCEDGGIYLVAIKDIYGCRGGDNGQEVTVNYRESVKLITTLYNEVSP